MQGEWPSHTAPSSALSFFPALPLRRPQEAPLSWDQYTSTVPAAPLQPTPAFTTQPEKQPTVAASHTAPLVAAVAHEAASRVRILFFIAAVLGLFLCAIGRVERAFSRPPRSSVALHAEAGKAAYDMKPNAAATLASSPDAPFPVARVEEAGEEAGERTFEEEADGRKALQKQMTLRWLWAVKMLLIGGILLSLAMAISLRPVRALPVPKSGFHSSSPL